MVASYAISDAPCRDGDARAARHRRALRAARRGARRRRRPPTELPSFGLVARAHGEEAAADPERAELRERRKVAKAERRAAGSANAKARATAQASRREALHAPSARPPPADPSQPEPRLEPASHRRLTADSRDAGLRRVAE